MTHSPVFRDIKFNEDVKAALMCYYNMEALRRMGYDPDPVEEEYLKGILQEHLHIPGLDDIIDKNSFPGDIEGVLGYVNSYAHKQILKSLQPGHVLKYNAQYLIWSFNLELPALEGLKISRIALFGQNTINITFQNINDGNKFQVEACKPPSGSALSHIHPEAYEVSPYDPYFVSHQSKAKIAFDTLNDTYGAEWKLHTYS